ncbi:MAG: hypothetical protein QM796_04935 [Chthoniobacteraceae bacterium]
MILSDLVSDEEIPAEMQEDAELWSGCVSGVMTEWGLLQALAEAGFYGIRILQLDEQPWRIVQGIEFRSLTVEAFKGKQGPCFERNQAVIYRGPFKEVLDDDGHRMERGRRYAVCDKTYQLYQKSPYRDNFEFIEPVTDIPLVEAKPFDCTRTAWRDPRETKGMKIDASSEAASAPSSTGSSCGGGACC